MLDNLSPASPTVLLIAAAILVAVVARQLQARRLRPARLAVLPAALLLFGLQDAPLLAGMDAVQALLLAVSVAGGAVLGAARGYTLRVWVDATGQVWSRGTWLTLVLWAGLIVFRIAAGAAVLWLRRPARVAMARA